MSTRITGIGWITPKKCGGLIKNKSRDFDSLQSLQKILTVNPLGPHDFSRLDVDSQIICSAVSLSLEDADMHYTYDFMRNTGIVTANPNGCLQSNLEYFKDYLYQGRSRARGRLFVYTLPSSPAAITAIHFKCLGPVLYMGSLDNQVSSLLIHAENMITDNQLNGIFVIFTQENSSICFFILKQSISFNNDLLTIKQAVRLINNQTGITQIIKALRKAN